MIKREKGKEGEGEIYIEAVACALRFLNRDGTNGQGRRDKRDTRDTGEAGVVSPFRSVEGI